MKYLKAKIRDKGIKGPESYEYNNEIIFNDYKKLALFFLDLSNYGANIEKSFEEYKKLKQEQFPW